MTENIYTQCNEGRNCSDLLYNPIKSCHRPKYVRHISNVVWKKFTVYFGMTKRFSTYVFWGNSPPILDF